MPTPNDILSLPSGAQWLKADLHVHTPASADIAEEWKTATPADVVRIAIEKSLDVIAVTDHNTAAWCDDVRQAAEGTSLTVFPGVEIFTSQGHLLAIFDRTVTASHIEDLLIGLNISRDQIGSLHVATEKGIVGVSESIEKAGGVAIAAHADGQRGFLKMISVGAERERAYLARDLRAIEILDAPSRSRPSVWIPLSPAHDLPAIIRLLAERCRPPPARWHGLSVFPTQDGGEVYLWTQVGID